MEERQDVVASGRDGLRLLTCCAARVLLLIGCILAVSPGLIIISLWLLQCLHLVPHDLGGKVFKKLRRRCLAIKYACLSEQW